MAKRHETIGIKQSIRLEWMQKAANLLLAGLEAKAVRKELHEFLSEKRGNGSEVERSDMTRTFVVNILMNIWGSPDPNLTSFRDASLTFLREDPSMAFAIHWGMISAVYPFWYNVAQQSGRLLALQDQVTQRQIVRRLKEQYGDRQTISRYTRYVIRSFVAWGALKDTDVRGCYKKASSVYIKDVNLAVLMFESALLANSEANSPLGLLLNNPAFFPFQLPVMTGDYVSQRNARIGVVRIGLDDELVKLKE